MVYMHINIYRKKKTWNIHCSVKMHTVGLVVVASKNVNHVLNRSQYEFRIVVILGVRLQMLLDINYFLTELS